MNAQESLGLSDDEFLKQDPSAFLTDEVEEASDAEQVLDSAEESAEEESLSADMADEDSEAQEQPEISASEEEVGQPEEDIPQEHETSPDSEDTESLDTSSTDSADTKEDTPDTGKFDYKSAYQKVTQPFKANGADIQVTDPNDIIRLMQMGANYQKKMAQLKPNLKVIKMLEKNGLLDETKLHNLIDLSKNDPKAVAKLIKESGVDPLDIDTDGAADYQPNNYSVSDKEYNLDQVLDSIKDTPTFDKTISVLTKEWDNQSKQTISENPEIINIINTHVSNGVYDKVNEVLQQEKALGKLMGISDVEAYRQVAERLYQQGVLREQTGQSADSAAQVSSKTQPSKANAERSKKRKAAAPVKQTTSTNKTSEEDFLGLSDEEFMKKYASR